MFIQEINYKKDAPVPGQNTIKLNTVFINISVRRYASDLGQTDGRTDARAERPAR